MIFYKNIIKLYLKKKQHKKSKLNNEIEMKKH